MHPLAWLCVLLMGYIALAAVIRVRKLPQDQRRRYLLRQAGLFALFYGGMVVMLMWLERLMVFHPMRFPASWQPPSGMVVEDVWLDPGDGNRIHAFWCPTPGAQWVLLYNHGNAGHIGGRIFAVQTWQQRLGASVLIYDYPQFGRSTGTLDEASCYRAATAAYRWLRETKDVPPEQLLLYGKSLGCAPAVELAIQHPHHALILMSPFLSIPDMAQEIFPIFPARWIARTQFDNASKIPQYQGRLLIAHGTADAVVPHHHGQRLAELATQARWNKFLSYPGWGHGAPPNEFYPEVAAMLHAPQPQTDETPAAPRP